MGQVSCQLAISLDGYVAGPRQSRDKPLGIGGEQLHRWQFEAAEDNAEEIAALTAPKAFIMGRNMFGPVRGPWQEPAWQGWWGEEPPYHSPVFVLTHYPRPTVEMKGGTTFHFITGGPEEALHQATAVAGDGNIDIAGGAHTARQFLAMGAVDQLRMHLAPVILGEGEPLFTTPLPNHLVPVSSRTTSLVTHLTYRFTPKESP